jgi:adenosylhomocysteine nucleosidase
MPGRVAIVCAMAQEIQPLVRGWKKIRERGLTFFESEKAVAVIAGIGSAPAAMASMTLIAREQPCCLMSAGLAGALRDDLHVGDVLWPRMVINAATSRRFETRNPEPNATMVSGKSIAGEKRKRELREEFQADAIDMEGAGVASIADSCGLPFYAVKAISDEVDFEMPPLNNFVDAKGKLHMFAYGLRALVHPAWWGPTLTLARNGHTAAVELSKAVAHQIEQLVTESSGALVPRT